jgi:uncharacterized damage-inducible protein DinB
VEPAARAIAGAVVSKIQEQIERTVHLIGLLPAEPCEWRPPIAGAWTVGELLGHLLDCLAGFCAVLQAAYPERLAAFAALRNLPVNQVCGPAEARERIEAYRQSIEHGCAVLNDAGLERKLPTVFVAEGEPVMTLLLGNLEHLVNHKHQLFVYLKLMDVDVGTPDLYQFRGAQAAPASEP